MQLELAQKSQLSQSQEIEALKEMAQKYDEMTQLLKSQDEEQHRKDLSHASEVHICAINHTLFHLMKFLFQTCCLKHLYSWLA